MSVTKTQINTLLTTLLGGVPMDDTLFDLFLKMKKDIRESSRDWMVLRSLDTSISFLTSDIYTTGKTLPARFIRVVRPSYKDQDDMGVSLVDSNGNITPLKPVALGQRYAYKDAVGYYWIDVKNGTIGRTGTQAGTLYLSFLQGSVDIDDADPWPFPDYASILLAFDLAIMQKGGIDWDVVSSFGVPYNQNTIKELESALAMWDANLQAQELGV